MGTLIPDVNAPVLPPKHVPVAPDEIEAEPGAPEEAPAPVEPTADDMAEVTL